MVCPNCGSKMPDDVRICLDCGAELTKIEPGAPKPDWEREAEEKRRQNWEEYQKQHGQYQQSAQPAFTQPLRQTESIQTELPMKWYLCIIYVYLFWIMLTHVMNAVTLLTGSQNSLYQTLSGDERAFAQTLDRIYAVLLLAMAVCAFLVRQRLVRFKKNSPLMFIVHMAVDMAIRFAYIIISPDGFRLLTANLTSSLPQDMTISEDMLLRSYIIIGIAMVAAVIILNIIYFRKRRHLFNN